MSVPYLSQLVKRDLVEAQDSCDVFDAVKIVLDAVADGFKLQATAVELVSFGGDGDYLTLESVADVLRAIGNYVQENGMAPVIKE